MCDVETGEMEANTDPQDVGSDNTDGPSQVAKASTIVLDPYTASELFHYIIEAVLEELMGIKGHTSYKKGNREFLVIFCIIFVQLKHKVI